MTNRNIHPEAFKQFENEELTHNAKIKKALRTAKPSDFQIVVLDNDSDYPYAASFWGCEDIAIFKRKADCQRFIDSFGNKGE